LEKGEGLVTKTENKGVIEPQLSTIPEFCRRNHIAKSTFFKLKNAGLGPRIMYLGKMQRISADAERDWIAARENPTADEAEQIERDEAARSAQCSQKGKLGAASPLHHCRQNEAQAQRAIVRKAKEAAREAERLAREARDAWRKAAAQGKSRRKQR
jgi:hypothetical protein